MKHNPIFLALALMVGLTAIAQENATVGQNDLEAAEPERDTTSEVVQATSPLNELEWMVGKWVDQGENATIVTDCSWTKNRKFLKRSFKVKVDEEVTLEGDQFVGWDPIADQIRSWTFDSEGGIGDGRWIQDGNRWLVKASFVLADGARASALNVYTHVDDDTIRWQSTNREIAGELQPNIPEVTVGRKTTDEIESQESEKEASR
jgi:hypothetical protein